MITSFRNIPAILDKLALLPRVASPLIWVALYLAVSRHAPQLEMETVLAFAGVMNALNGFEQYYISVPGWFSYSASCRLSLCWR